MQKLLKVKKLDPRAKLPNLAYAGDAGYDLYALEEYTLYPFQPTKVRTGIAIELPPGYFAEIHTRSSFGAKGIKAHLGIIDNGYRGEVYPILTLLDLTDPVVIPAGTKVAQLIVRPLITFPVKEVQTLSQTERGNKGFGSSNVS